MAKTALLSKPVLLWSVSGILLGAPIFPAVIQAQELVTSSSLSHPLSYQGRTLTRDAQGNYFAVIRSGAWIKVWKRNIGGTTWSDLGAVNDTPLSGREGECASIATDGHDAIHVVYYDGASPNLVHKSSANGTAFGAQHLIQSDVTWNATGAGGPFLHIGKDNDLHVAFIDEAEENPYHAKSADGGTSWSVSKVSDAGGSDLTPSVITTPAGRLVYGYSAPGFLSRISDDGGTTWEDRNPPTLGTTANCRLAGNGDQVFVTCQKISPSPRAIVLNRCDGPRMDWGAWENISSGTGADASLVIAADLSPHIIWRHYPDGTRQVFRSHHAGGWKETPVSDSSNYILPYAYWQEYHRGNPAGNLISLLAPNATSNRIYFIQVEGVRYARDDAGGTSLRRTKDRILLAAEPDPAGGIAISFDFSPRAEGVKVAVYDLGGGLVRGLERGSRKGLCRWDGADRKGSRVAPGVYLITAESGMQKVSRRVAWLE